MSRSWLALVGVVVACNPRESKVPDDTGTSAGSPTAGSMTVPSFDCATDVPALPLPTPERIYGFTNAEDFAFDGEGRYVATDSFGNLVRITYDGEVSIWVPELGVTAGTAFLPDGSLAIANVDRGQVQRVYENGSTDRLIGALSYPNGVTVDKNGVVYVADQNLGQVIAYDPLTDDRRVIAEDLFNPNGLALGPGHETLFVGSFGGGTVHAIDLVAGGEPVLFGTTPTGTTTTTGGTSDACLGLVEGDECFQEMGLGECDAVGVCALALDEAACAGKVAGEACVTDTLGLPNSSVCADHPSGVLFCPEVPADVVEACVGLAEDDPCSAMGIDRNCRESWEGILVCDITPWTETAYAACDGLAVNDACVVLDVEAYTAGTCLQDPYGYGVVCTPDWGGYGYTFHGGLDGIAVDACGYVWVTEYTLGYVWRFPPQGGEPELAVETGTFWIPNMHWGNGVGGWEEEVMYMQDRSTDDLLVIPIGLPVAQP